MLENVLLGLLVMVGCLFVQALLVAAAARTYARHSRAVESGSFASTVLLIGGVMIVLVVGNFLQVCIWGALFLQLGEFEDFRVAVYHSAVNFATLGYGDIVMSEKHRILGPLQSLNGILMMGVSTAVVMSALQDALQRVRDARGNGPGAD
ncbi:two pore domain potassium channel family protein [Seongchinamella sediminis]|uniref:Two pore domain potassium channel family protein n=1 Tax=Seongchinamella sediminis TaxID=2283635 RepID=A0A3L7DWR7_9GAMM|nr:ion channel [Seongchinamella sediminis]RLQ21576.1 two pore domain potassium channel family protein [Seongchinamella sediminis]